jgi:hypothetical protein
MVTLTEQRIRPDWWLRSQVLVTAAAVAIETAEMFPHSSGQVPLTIACFVVVGSPLVAPRASHFRTACRVVGYVLLLGCVVGFCYASVYVLFFVMPLLIALSALIGIGAAAEEPARQVPVAARVELAVVAVSVALAFTETALVPTQLRTPLGMAGWGALALLPLLFRDRLGFRIAGIVTGTGLLLVYLGQPAATQVLAAGVAVVLTCCGESRATRAMALVTVGVSWLIPLLLLLTILGLTD